MSALGSAARVGGWSVSVSAIGLIVGAMVVMLPPMAAIGLVALSGLFLVWAMPELRWVPDKALRYAFFAAMCVEICIPNYYTIQLSGLPWISARRVFVFVMILILLIVIGGSKSAIQRIKNIMLLDRWLSACLIGFIVMGFISIFVSPIFTQSLSIFVDVVLNWYIPLLACLLVVHSESGLLTFVRLIALLSLVVAALGIAEFLVQHRIVMEILPASLLTKLIADNPSLQALTASPFRNGFYRASSIYIIPLSFGEFASMVAPIGGYFLLHGGKWPDRVLGVAVLLAAMLSLFVSGARGAIVAFLVSMPILAGLWLVRYSRAHRHSLLGVIGAVSALIGTVMAITLVLSVGRLHNFVIGGNGAAAFSNEGRIEQWRLALPHIVSNPIIGYGFGSSGQIIDFQEPGGLVSVDSYVLSVLVENGLPGLLFFAGIVAFPLRLCARIYLHYPDEPAALGGPLACSFLAFGIYRFFLSERENQTLFYLLVGVALVFAKQAFERATSRAEPNECSLQTKGRAS